MGARFVSPGVAELCSARAGLVSGTCCTLVLRIGSTVTCGHELLARYAPTAPALLEPSVVCSSSLGRVGPLAHDPESLPSICSQPSSQVVTFRCPRVARSAR